MLLAPETPLKAEQRKAAQIKEASLERCKTTPQPKHNHPLKAGGGGNLEPRTQVKKHCLHVRESVESILFQCRRPRHRPLFASVPETRGALYSNTYRLLLNLRLYNVDSSKAPLYCTPNYRDMILLAANKASEAIQSLVQANFYSIS